MSNQMSDMGRSLLLELYSKEINSINFLNYTSKSIGEVIDFFRKSLESSKIQDSSIEKKIEKLSDLYNERIDALEFNGYTINDEWAYLAELKGQKIPDNLLSSINRKKLDAENKWDLLKDYIKNEKRETAALFHDQRISAAEKETWLKVWNKIERKIDCLDAVGVRIMNPKDFDFSMHKEDL